MEKSYLLDDLLQLAIETFSPPRVFESLTKVFSLNPRWVFGLVKRVLERCSSAVSEDGEEEERVLLGLARENSGLQNHLIEV